MKNIRFGMFFLIIVLVLSALPLAAADLGEAAPPFVLTDLDRDYIFSKKVYGTGWILVDFYATWCENCNAELPHIEDIFLEYEDEGFQVFLLATDDEGHQKVRPHFLQNPTPITVLVDKYKKAVESFGVQALPSLFLIDPDGNIAFKSVGYHEEDIDRIKSILSEAYVE